MRIIEYQAFLQLYHLAPYLLPADGIRGMGKEPNHKMASKPGPLLLIQYAPTTFYVGKNYKKIKKYW
jgi:hypothetical protein